MTTDAKPQPTVKKPSKPSAEDDEAKPAAPARAGLLPTGLSRAIVISAVVLAAVILAGTLLPRRYALVPAARSENALVFRIDTLTGHVSLCSTAQCQPVAEK